MHTGLEESRDGYESLAAYFAERAAGQVGLMVTGGIAPNWSGWVSPFSARLASKGPVRRHRQITNAVHAEGGKICLQILHAGRYGYHPLCVAPSAIKSPISPFKPWALTRTGIRRTIADFARTAALAREAGYDGVEVMGSEGYLINQFLVNHTNKRRDSWGGTYENRMRFPLEIVRAVRKAVGHDFIIIFRLSLIDLIPDGSSWEEIVLLAQQLEKEGVNLINSGIGWHEARVPTIATQVPRGTFTWLTARLRQEVSLPVIATNRINMPNQAEEILEQGAADMVSMARPFLADPEWARKAMEGRNREINTCIACNQACLDHVFSGKTASCLVNPRACNETTLRFTPTALPRKIGVIGAGPAGLTFAIHAAERGHEVHLFEKETEIGGQFRLAARIPGKEEFRETLRYFEEMLRLRGVNMHLGTALDEEKIWNLSMDEWVFAAGVKPREVSDIAGFDDSRVVSYPDLLSGKVPPGDKVAIIGSGGVGFDVATFLAHSQGYDTNSFLSSWGVDTSFKNAGGLLPGKEFVRSPRTIYMLQRKQGKAGKSLGKTTGWIHRTELQRRGVVFLSGITYERLDEQGLHLSHADGHKECLAVDQVVICAGQEPAWTFPFESMSQLGTVHRIGGVRDARELDAQKAIHEAAQLAAAI